MKRQVRVSFQPRLESLEQRCTRLLQMQTEVYHGTVNVDHDVQANPDKRPGRVQEQRSLQLADQEEKIVLEATAAIRLLEAEGSGRRL